MYEYSSAVLYPLYIICHYVHLMSFLNVCSVSKPVKTPDLLAGSDSRVLFFSPRLLVVEMWLLFNMHGLTNYRPLTVIMWPWVWRQKERAQTFTLSPTQPHIELAGKTQQQSGSVWIKLRSPRWRRLKDGGCTYVRADTTPADERKMSVHLRTCRRRRDSHE